MIRYFSVVSFMLLSACAPHVAPALPHRTGAFAPDSTHSIELASGVTYTRLHIPSGPWDACVVTVAPDAHGVEFCTVKGLDHVVGREKPSSMARRTAAAERRPVLAAVSADFFNFKPPGVSEGPQVSAGHVVKSEDTHRAALSDTMPGDSVWWSLRIRNAPAKVKELVGGFPMLLRHGAAVVDRISNMIPGFSERRHPRTVVARRGDGTVMLVAVDGRREGSVGMTLDELTNFVKALGASDALNLDGGGSTTLVVEGRVVNSPSDKEGARAVSNVLLLLGP